MMIFWFLVAIFLSFTPFTLLHIPLMADFGLVDGWIVRIKIEE
jgi:hypothetical protein